MKRRLIILGLVTTGEAVALAAWFYLVDRQLARASRAGAW